MEKNVLNNNKENFTISVTTNNMLALLRDFIQLQNRLIVVYDGEVGGENVIEASAELYRFMQDDDRHSDMRTIALENIVILQINYFTQLTFREIQKTHAL